MLISPLGGVEWPRRMVRFAQLIHRRGPVLGGPSVRAACGGILMPAGCPRRVAQQEQVGDRRATTWARGCRIPTGIVAASFLGRRRDRSSSGLRIIACRQSRAADPGRLLVRVRREVPTPWYPQCWPHRRCWSSGWWRPPLGRDQRRPSQSPCWSGPPARRSHPAVIAILILARAINILPG